MIKSRAMGRGGEGRGEGRVITAALAFVAALVAVGAARATPAPPNVQPPAASAAPSAPPADPELDARKQQALELFREGERHLDAEEWSAALDDYQHSYAVLPNPRTLWNVGFCAKHLERYVEAKSALSLALQQNEETQSPKGEPWIQPERVRDTKEWLGAIDGIVVRASVHVDPPTASLSVDGRAVVLAPQLGDGAYMTLGTANHDEAVPAADFELLLDPGDHIFVLSQKGFKNATVNRVLDSGPVKLDLEIKKLPAAIEIKSSEAGAVVKVDASDVGNAPVTVSRAAGTYKVIVSKPGFVPYQTTVTLQPGEQTTLNAKLEVDKPSVAERWWFWLTIGGGAAAVGVVTYFAARPAPEPPPYDGGTTGWVIQSYPVRF